MSSYLHSNALVTRNWPVAGLTVASGCLESLLLIGAVWLYYRGTPAPK